MPWGNAIVAFLTRNPVTCLALICLLSAGEFGCAASSLRGTRVVWVRGDRVYIASPDSIPLEAGTLLTFKDRGKQVAGGEVTAVHDGEMIAAKLTTGSLAKVKRLERLEVAVDPPYLRAPPILRVGYPAAGRKNLLFDCPNHSPDSSLRVVTDRHSQLQRFYKSEILDGRTYRLLRDSTALAAGSWPDTLLVRMFDEVTDEEIALERGDLDVGVFWPGEASAHIREVTRWARREGGIGVRGLLTATVVPPCPPGMTCGLSRQELQALERLNHELFRDDLGQVWITEPVSAVLGRFEVDASLPGRAIMERILNRAAGDGAPVDTTRILRIHYKEIWPAEPIVGCLTGVQCLTVRCPVISGPKLRPYLHSIDTEALANLFQCLPPVRKP